MSDISKNPNPQGKGLTPVLDCLNACRAVTHLPAKKLEQITNELFTSLFVLHSRFQFKPVVGTQYSLYRKGEHFTLSLIKPNEGGTLCLGRYVGQCVLHEDVTWTLQLDEQSTADLELMQLIANRRQAFELSLQKATSLQAALPVYVDSLPFYQRAFASALASSLKVSMQKSGISTLRYDQCRQLPGPDE